MRQKSFAFDRIFTDSNGELFMGEVKPLLDQVIADRGCHHAVVAYGCTSSGKTHTMYNNEDGLLLKSMEYLLEGLRERPGFSVKARCVEIYMETCKDLFTAANKDKPSTAINTGPLNLPSSSNTAKNAMKYLFTPNISSAESSLTRRSVGDITDFQSIISEVLESRKISATGANMTSSRSHCLVFIDLFDPEDRLHSCLIFGDLAGSERFKTTMKSDPKHQQEAGSINKSLHVFHNVIHAMRENWSHIPIRDSKLTQLLAKSLIGSGNLTLLIAVNDDPRFSDETFHVLEFGAIVRQVEPHRPKIDSGLQRSNTWWSGKKKLEFGNIVKSFADSPLRTIASATAVKLSTQTPIEIPQGWEAVVETMVRARETSLRQEMILEHAQNSDRLRELYEKIMEETLAETEDKFNSKMEMLAKSYQTEIINLQGIVDSLQTQLEQKDEEVYLKSQTGVELMKTSETFSGLIQNLQEQIQSLQTSVNEYRSENCDLKKEYEFINKVLEDKNMMITALEERIVDLQNEQDSRKLSFNRNQRFSDILNISPIKNPVEPCETIVEESGSGSPPADLTCDFQSLHNQSISAPAVYSVYVDTGNEDNLKQQDIVQENKENYETAEESEAETEFQDADDMQVDMIAQPQDKAPEVPLINIVPNLEDNNSTPVKKELMSPIFAKLGLKSAFKLRLPKNHEDKPSKRKRNLRNRSHSDNDENEILANNDDEAQKENNGETERQIGPGQPPVKRKVKLRSKKAIFDSPL